MIIKKYLFVLPCDQEKVLLEYAAKGFLRALTYYSEEKESIDLFISILIKNLRLLQKDCISHKYILTNNTDIFYHLVFSGFLYGFSVGVRTIQAGFPEGKREELYQGNKESENYYYSFFKKSWKQLNLYNNYFLVSKKEYFSEFTNEMKRISIPVLNNFIIPCQEIFLSEERIKKAIYSEWIL